MLNWQRDFISSRFSDIPVFQPSQVPRIVSLWREKASRTLAGIGQKVSAFLVASNKQEFNSYSKVSVVLFELVVSKQLAFSCYTLSFQFIILDPTEEKKSNTAEKTEVHIIDNDKPGTTESEEFNTAEDEEEFYSGDDVSGFHTTDEESFV